jgi:hypothetical protein
VSLATKIRAFKRLELASIVFFAVTGIILLATLPLAGYPPHVGFLGILSLITAFSLFTKRAWAPWLVAILFITIIGFTLVTLFSAGFSNLIVGLSMLGYFILALVFTAYLLLRRKD